MGLAAKGTRHYLIRKSINNFQISFHFHFQRLLRSSRTLISLSVYVRLKMSTQLPMKAEISMELVGGIITIS